MFPTEADLDAKIVLDLIAAGEVDGRNIAVISPCSNEKLAIKIFISHT